MKSAPPAIATSEARRTASYVPSSPVSRITFRCALPHASLTATISSYTCPIRPERKAPRSITMSISSAPASTAARTSASFTSSGACPAGKAVATEATFTRAPDERPARDAHQAGIDADGGDRRNRRFRRDPGRTAFALSARTLPGVSAPSSVVRSIIRIASSRAKIFDSRLIDRFASSAARASRATASTAPTRGRRPPPGSSSARGASVWVMAAV